jgi:hypothetical protein
MTAVAISMYGVIIVWRYLVDRKAQRERDEIKERLDKIEEILQ